MLIACEESQAVCKEFRRLGHEAYSCDIQECSGGHPEWHIHGNVLPLLNGKCEFETADGQYHSLGTRWDLIVAHPPCTDLAVSGARWFLEKQKDFRQQRSCVFFMYFALAWCDRIAVENPIGIMSNIYRKPDQIIQPWMFGDAEEKKTCLWLKGLPNLTETNVTVPPERIKFDSGKSMPKWYADAWRLSKEERQRGRSKTFPGIAKAMAEQWSKYILNN